MHWIVGICIHYLFSHQLCAQSDRRSLKQSHPTQCLRWMLSPQLEQAGKHMQSFSPTSQMVCNPMQSRSSRQCGLQGLPHMFRSWSPTFAHVSMGQATGTCARVSEHTVGGPARYSPGQPQRDAGAQAGEGEGEHQHPPLHHTDAGGRQGGGVPLTWRADGCASGRAQAEPFPCKC